MKRRVSDGSLPSRAEALFFSRPCMASHHTASYSTQAATSAGPVARAAGPVQTQAYCLLWFTCPVRNPRVSRLWPTVQCAGLAGWDSVGGEDLALGRLNLASDLSPVLRLGAQTLLVKDFARG